MDDVRLKELSTVLQRDIRLEVILADLVNDSFNLDELMVINNGQFQRSYHSDIEKVEENEYGKAKKKKLCLSVNRNGLYDNLPEDIFHQPSDSKNSTDKEKIIKEIKLQSELEKSARKFFVPYEQEFYRLRIKLELEERKYLFETNSDISDQLFADLWSFPDYLDKLQKSKLGVMMPVINRIVGDDDISAFVIGNITGDSVDIYETPPLKFTLERTVKLGDCVLGLDSILDGEVAETKRSVTVKIFLKDSDKVVDYLPGGKKNKIYEFLCNLLIPLENDVVYDIDFEEQVNFELDDENPQAARLNYTTVI